MRTVLVAGFGPFPGAPRNPSGELALALGRVRRPCLAGVRIHAVVLPTIYRTVERDLANLIAKLGPDAILLFGLAGRSDRLRVETRAVNAASRLHPDAARTVPSTCPLFKNRPRELFVKAPVQRVLAAARAARVPARLSRDAGRYVCNACLFLCLDTARKKQRPPLVTFIHIPMPRAPRRRRGPRMAALVRAGGAILAALAAEASRPETRLNRGTALG